MAAFRARGCKFETWFYVQFSSASFQANNLKDRFGQQVIPDFTATEIDPLTYPNIRAARPLEAIQVCQIEST